MGFGYRAIRFYDCVLTEEQLQRNHTVDLLARYRVDPALYTVLSEQEQAAIDATFATVMMDDTSKAALESSLITQKMADSVNQILQFDGISVRKYVKPALRASFTFDLDAVLPESVSIVEIGAITAKADGSLIMQDLLLEKDADGYACAENMSRVIAYQSDASQAANADADGHCFTIQADHLDTEWTVDDYRAQHMFRGYVILSVNGAEAVCYVDGFGERYYTNGRISLEETASVPELRSFETTQNVINAVNADSLKILMIGNSFSDDAYAYFYRVAESLGIKNVVIGKLSIGGSALSVHASNALNNQAAYSYQKWTSEGNSSQSNVTLLAGLTDENWSYITIQQLSNDSGHPTTFSPHMQIMIDYINENKTYSKARIGWHMTWAYQQGSDHWTWTSSPGSYYNADQMTMYGAICDAAENYVMTNPAMAFAIPSGTAIQNVRTGSIGDNVTRDTYHLNNLGRLIVSYTYVAKLTGTVLTDLPYIPSDVTLTESQKQEIVAAINSAIVTPYDVTPLSGT